MYDSITFMIPIFLITFREVMEASLIVATILGFLIKLKRWKDIRTVWMAAGAGCIISILLVFAGSIAGVTFQKMYSGHIESFVEGILMTISAVFISMTIISLHSHMSLYKTKLRTIMQGSDTSGWNYKIFLLVFTAVLREGFEIVLSLTTIYLSSESHLIIIGFCLGFAAGLIISVLFVWGAIRLPMYWVFRASNVLLILFAAGLLARSVHEFTEIGVIPAIDLLQLSVYLSYIFFMHRLVFVRSR